MVRIAIVTAVFALAGCSTYREAEVVERSWDPKPVRTTPRAPSPPPRVREHIVARGDTLHGIAFEHGVSLDELARWNALSPPYTIYPGQRLALSGASRALPRTAPPVERTTTYAVPSAAPAAPVLLEPAPAPARIAAPPSRVATTPATPSAPIRAPRRAPPPPGAPRTTTPAVSASSRAEPAQATAIAPTAPPASSVPATPAAPKPAPAAAIAPAPSRAVGGVVWRWPALGSVIAGFRAGDPARQGIDIRGRGGDAVLAAADGQVVYSGSGLAGYGELIIVKHAGEFLSAYAYNRKRLVAEGDAVRAGQAIAEMGRRGGGADALHFEIRRDGQPVDPMQFLPRK